MTAVQIAETCRSMVTARVRLLILTGGEPTLQVDEELLRVLHEAGFFISIETNGTMPLPKGIDWVTCSPKENSDIVLRKVDELKIVFTGQNPERYKTLISTEHYYLQPCSTENTSEVIDYILQHPDWRLSLQTHKYIGIR